jgi:hypothetical protein
MCTPLLVGIYQTDDYLRYIYICNTSLVLNFTNIDNFKNEHLILIYKGKLDIHLVNMEKHCSGVYSGAICPEPCKINHRYNEFAQSHQVFFFFLKEQNSTSELISNLISYLHSCKCHSIRVSPCVST